MIKNISMKKISRIIIAFTLTVGLIFAMAPEATYAASISKKSVSQVGKLIKVAKSKRGCRYSAGSRGPNRFDCTGFVYYCMRKSGIKIRKGRLAPYKSSKYNVGRSIKKAKKGDILLYYRGGRIGHAAIYIGGGKVIHATSRGVRITRWNGFGQRLAAVIRVYSPAKKKVTASKPKVTVAKAKPAPVKTTPVVTPVAPPAGTTEQTPPVTETQDTGTSPSPSTIPTE